MDSTEGEWSVNAEDMLIGQTIPVRRIGLSEMRASPVQWDSFAARHDIVLEPRKDLRPHQREALDAVRAGLTLHDRGKLIMACGTGKTFTALKIAEDLVGADGRILFLVPSLALMAQTVREWSHDSTTALRSLPSARTRRSASDGLPGMMSPKSAHWIWPFPPPPMQAFWQRALPMPHPA